MNVMRTRNQMRRQSRSGQIRTNVNALIVMCQGHGTLMLLMNIAKMAPKANDDLPDEPDRA